MQEVSSAKCTELFSVETAVGTAGLMQAYVHCATTTMADLAVKHARGGKYASLPSLFYQPLFF